MLRTAFLFLSGLFLCGCTTFKEPQFTGVKDFNMDKLDMSGMEATAVLGIKNPNPVGFSVYRSKFDIYYDGIYLGKTRSKKRVHISANSEKKYDFHFKGSFKNIGLAEVMKLVANAGRGRLEIKGDVKVGKFFIRKRFPVNENKRVGF